MLNRSGRVARASPLDYLGLALLVAINVVAELFSPPRDQVIKRAVLWMLVGAVASRVL